MARVRGGGGRSLSSRAARGRGIAGSGGGPASGGTSAGPTFRLRFRLRSLIDWFRGKPPAPDAEKLPDTGPPGPDDPGTG